MPSCPNSRCKATLKPVVSNSTAPNNYRIRLYCCEKCSEKENRTVIVSITTKIVPDTQIWKIINIDIFKTQKS